MSLLSLLNSVFVAEFDRYSEESLWSLGSLPIVKGQNFKLSKRESFFFDVAVVFGDKFWILLEGVNVKNHSYIFQPSTAYPFSWIVCYF